METNYRKVITNHEKMIDEMLKETGGKKETDWFKVIVLTIIVLAGIYSLIGGGINPIELFLSMFGYSGSLP